MGCFFLSFHGVFFCTLLFLLLAWHWQHLASQLVALLEVGGSDKQIHMVKIGDEIAFDRNDPSLVFKIRSIDRLSVIVEVGTLGDVIIVR